MANRKAVLKIENLVTVVAKTNTQRQFFDIYQHYPVIILHGVAGTGKTFIALYKALEDVLDKGNPYDRVILVRSPITTGKNIGALPGDVSEKSDPFQYIYYDLCFSLFNSVDAYTRLKEQKKMQFCFTTHLRGVTFDNSVIVCDEVQNLTYQELKTIITRLGVNSKIVFCGDTRQNDLNGQSGLDKFRKIVDNMSQSKHLEFGVEDIVRSDVVKEFIIEEMKHG